MSSENGREEYFGDLGGGPSSSEGPGGLGDVFTAVAIVGAEVGELRAQQQDILDRAAAVDTRLDGIDAHLVVMGELTNQVTGLSAAVANLLGRDEGAEVDPLRPVDLAHIPLEERANALESLVRWVHDVLMRGWPHIRLSWRSCWPYHPDLVNAMLMVRTAWITAYDTKDARVHHAVDFHRTLDETARWAESRTASCTQTSSHALPLPPRDDWGQAMRAIRRDALAEVSSLYATASGTAAGAEAQEVEEARQRVGELVAQFDLKPEEIRGYMSAESKTQSEVTQRERTPSQERR